MFSKLSLCTSLKIIQLANVSACCSDLPQGATQLHPEEGLSSRPKRPMIE